jgi:hypothetical protein
MSSHTRELRPLYAAAGLTDLIAAALRDRLAHAQGEAVQRWADLKQKAPDMPVALSRATRERISVLQTRAGQVAAEAGTTYNELAERGKGPVDEAFGAARSLGQKWLSEVRVINRGERPAETAVEAESGPTVEPTVEPAEPTSETASELKPETEPETKPETKPTV